LKIYLDTIYRDNYGEKKKMKIRINPVNPVQKDFSSLLNTETASIIKHSGYDSSEAATSQFVLS